MSLITKLCFHGDFCAKQKVSWKAASVHTLPHLNTKWDFIVWSQTYYLLHLATSWVEKWSLEMSCPRPKNLPHAEVSLPLSPSVYCMESRELHALAGSPGHQRKQAFMGLKLARGWLTGNEGNWLTATTKLVLSCEAARSCILPTTLPAWTWSCILPQQLLTRRPRAADPFHTQADVHPCSFAPLSLWYFVAQQ